MRNQEFQEGNYNLRSGLVIFPVQQENIDRILTEVVQKLPAHFLMLLDVTGQIVAVRGEQTQVDLVALGSLVAGDLVASQEIARLTGQYQDYQMVLREGQKFHTFIVEAGHRLAMLVQIANETPLGWARLLIQNAARQLADIVAASSVARANGPFNLNLDKQELPDLFSDALEDLWKE